MKNISYVISGVLAVAMIVLYILFFTSKGKGVEQDSVTSIKSDQDSLVLLPIAYVDVDTLLANYEFAKVSLETLMSKYKSSNYTVGQKQQEYEREATDFQRKLQTNAFLSQERARQESQRIEHLGAELQKITQRLEGELMRDEQRINENIIDSIRVCLGDYNKVANYQMIFSNKGMDNIMIAKAKYDITQKVLAMLNGRYIASGGKVASKDKK